MSNKQMINSLDIQLNSIKLNEKDPTLLDCKFIILDFQPSHHNIVVEKEEALQLGQTIKGKPVRAKYYNVSNVNAKDDDFGDHEATKDVDRNGKEYIKRNTTPIGVFVSDGYIEEVDVDGETREVLIADAQLWYSQFKDACDLLVEWFENDIKINMSCEYLYSNHKFIDGIEYHLSPLYFEAHCILGSDVAPAYDSATLLQFNQLEKFNLLVAQALNTKKEVNDLEENQELQVNNENENPEEQKTQLNELSLYQISDEVRNQVKASVKDEQWLWVSDIYQTYAVVAVETEEDYKHFKYEYSVEGDIVTVNLDSKAEVKEKREWQVVTNSLNEQIVQLNTEKESLTLKVEELSDSKTKLAEKFNAATETITQLNTELEELKPLKEQILLAQEEAKLTEAKEKFEAQFNSVGATEMFATEEVQTLVAQSIIEGEEGLNAKLSLNEKIVDFITNKKVELPVQQVMNQVAKRENLVTITETFESKYSV